MTTFAAVFNFLNSRPGHEVLMALLVLMVVLFVYWVITQPFDNHLYDPLGHASARKARRP